MTGTKTNKDGITITTHRCESCGRRFAAAVKHGRPFKKCPSCRKE